jgi:hypothetical protein
MGTELTSHSSDLDSMGMDLRTPLSMPSSADGLPVSTIMDISGFGYVIPPQFHNYISFAHA